MSAAPPLNIQQTVRRFTTEYVVPEDRLRIAVERMDDTVCVLWLTRRLTLRLIPQIVKILANLSKFREAGQAGPTDNAQRRNQLEALGKLEQQDAVLAGIAEVPRGQLVTAMSVTLRHGFLIIDFKVDENVVQSLPFSESALRQWLGLLYGNFRQGQWNDDVWPAWITARGGERGPDALRLN